MSVDAPVWVLPPRPAFQADRTLAVVAQASFFVGQLIVPLAIYVIYRKRRPWAACHAADAFNFQAAFVLAQAALIVAMLFSGELAVVLVLGFITWWVYGMSSAVSRIKAAADDELRPYRPSVRILRRPRLGVSS